jgi:hypothetical protein
MSPAEATKVQKIQLGPVVFRDCRAVSVRDGARIKHKLMRHGLFLTCEK